MSKKLELRSETVDQIKNTVKATPSEDVRIEKAILENSLELNLSAFPIDKKHTNPQSLLDDFVKGNGFIDSIKKDSQIAQALRKNPEKLAQIQATFANANEMRERADDLVKNYWLGNVSRALDDFNPPESTHFDSPDNMFDRILKLPEFFNLLEDNPAYREFFKEKLNKKLQDKYESIDANHDAFIENKFRSVIANNKGTINSINASDEDEFERELMKILGSEKINDSKDLGQEISAHKDEKGSNIPSILKDAFRENLVARTEKAIEDFNPPGNEHFDTEDQVLEAAARNSGKLFSALKIEGNQAFVSGRVHQKLKAKYEEIDQRHDLFLINKFEELVKSNKNEINAIEAGDEVEFREKLKTIIGKEKINNGMDFGQEFASHDLDTKPEVKNLINISYKENLSFQRKRVETEFNNWVKARDIDAHDYDTPEKLIAEFTKDNPKLAKAMVNKDNEPEIKKFFGDQLVILKQKHEQEMQEINSGIDEFLARIESGEIDFDPHDLDWNDLMKEYFKTAPESHKKEIMEEHHQKMFFGRFQEAFDRIKEKHDQEMKEINEGVDDFFRKVESGEIDFDPHGKKWEDLLSEYFKLHPNHRKEMMEEHHQELFFPKFESKFNKLKEKHEQDMKDMKADVRKWADDIRSGKVQIDIRSATAQSLMEEYFKTAPAEFKKEMEEDHHKPEFLEQFGKILENIRKGADAKKAETFNDIQSWFTRKNDLSMDSVKDPDQLRAAYIREGKFGKYVNFVKDTLKANDFDPLFQSLYKQLSEKEQAEGKNVEAAAANFGKTKEAKENKTWEKFEAAFVKMNPKLEANWKMKPAWQNILKKEYGKLHKEGAIKLKADEKEADDKIKQFASTKEAKSIKTIEQFEMAFLNQDIRLREKFRNNPSLMKKLRDEFGKLQKNETTGGAKESSENSESTALTRRYNNMLHQKIVDKTISVETAIKYREWFGKIDDQGKKEAIEKFTEDMKQRQEVKDQFEKAVSKEIRDRYPNFYNLGKSGRAKVMGEIARELFGEKQQETAPGSAEAQEIQKMETKLTAVLADNVGEKNISLGTYTNFREWFRDSNLEGKKHIMQVLSKEMSDRAGVRQEFETLPKDIQEKNQRFYEMGGYPRQLLMKDIRKQLEGKDGNMQSTEQEKSVSENLFNTMKSKLDANLAKKNIAPRAHAAFIEWFEESDIDERKKIVADLDKEIQRREETREMFEKLPKAVQELNEDFYELRQYPREQRLKEIEREMETGKYEEAIMMEAGDDEPASTPNRMPIEMDKLKALFPQNFRRFYEFLQFYNTKQFEVFLRKGIVNKRPQQFIPRLFENFKFKLRFTTATQRDPLLKQDFLRGLEKLGIQNPWQPKKKKEEIDKDITKNQNVEKGSASYKFYEQNKEEAKPEEKEMKQEEMKEEEVKKKENVEKRQDEEIEKEIDKKQETAKSEMIEEKDEVEVPEEEVMKKEELVEEPIEKEEVAEEAEKTEDEEQELKPKIEENQAVEQEHKENEEETATPERTEAPQDELLKDLLRIAREKEIKDEAEAENTDHELADMLALLALLKSRKGMEKKKILVDETKDKKTRLRETKQDAESSLAQMINSLSDPNTPFDDFRASKVSEMLVTGRLSFVSPRILHSLIAKLFAMPIDKNTLKPKLKEILANDVPDAVNVAALFSVFQEIFLTGRETLIEFVRKFAHYACHILERNVETVVQIHPEPGSMIVRDQKQLFELLTKDLMDVRDKDVISRFAFSAEEPKKYLEIMNVRIVFGIHLGKKIALSFHEATLVTEEYLKGIAQEQRKAG